MAVDDDDIAASIDKVATTEGLLLCPEGAATYAAWEKAVKDGLISSEDTVVLFNCASGLKYELPPANARIDCHKPLDFKSMQK
jgi:threonine synthase